MPKFEQISGDVDAIHYGGFFKNLETGDWWYWGEPSNINDISVYRGSKPAQDEFQGKPWKWDRVLSCIGESKIPEDIYEQVRAIGSYYGWECLDETPTSYTEMELREILGLF